MRRGDVQILLVEDDRVDERAIARCFVQLGIVNPVVVARDGIEALAALREGAWAPGVADADLMPDFFV